MPTVSDFTKSMLALLMWREDGPDGLQGMTAVGLVVRNRVRAGWNGGDWCQVMEAHNQFSSMVWGVKESDPNTMRWPDTRDPKFQAVLLKADSIYDGIELDITGGAKFYANLSTANSTWFSINIIQSSEHPRVGTVGQQTFFA